MKNKHVLELFLYPEDDLSTVDITLDKTQVNELNQFFTGGEEFDFKSYQNSFCGFGLFYAFSAHVTEQNKDPFLKTVWDMFSDYIDKTDWHPWRGQFSPGGGELFAEGYLKYGLYLAEDEPYFDNIINYDSDWFDTTTAFLATVKRVSSQSTYGLFIYQFALNLADITKKEAPSLDTIKDLIRNEDQETIINVLASLACLEAQDFEKISLSLIPYGDIEVRD